MKVCFLLGSTGTGKSHFATLIAQSKQVSILNADSLQVYKFLDIGTAKPSHEDLNKYPHYLYSYVDLGEEYTAGRYRKSAMGCLSHLEKLSKMALIVGGSGFYIQALEKGMFQPGSVHYDIHCSVRQQAESKKGLEELYKELKNSDPEYANKINSNDKYRIQRAVELIREHKKPLSQLWLEPRSEKLPYSYIKVGLYLEREKLEIRIKDRIQNMLEIGFIDEVQSLLKKVSRGWSPFRSIGYKEVIQYLDGEITINELPQLILQNTMKLTKKQRTWFKRDKDIRWFHSEKQRKEALDYVVQWGKK